MRESLGCLARFHRCVLVAIAGDTISIVNERAVVQTPSPLLLSSSLTLSLSLSLSLSLAAALPPLPFPALAASTPYSSDTESADAESSPVNRNQYHAGLLRRGLLFS